LCPFDLGREHSFASNISVEEDVRVRKEKGDAVQPAQSQRRALEQALASVGELHGWITRKRIRNEGADLLIPGMANLVMAGRATVHAAARYSTDVE
jgi:hypothetical protein